MWDGPRTCPLPHRNAFCCSPRPLLPYLLFPAQKSTASDAHGGNRPFPLSPSSRVPDQQSPIPNHRRLALQPPHLLPNPSSKPAPSSRTPRSLLYHTPFLAPFRTHPEFNPTFLNQPLLSLACSSFALVLALYNAVLSHPRPSLEQAAESFPVALLVESSCDAQRSERGESTARTRSCEPPPPSVVFFALFAYCS